MDVAAATGISERSLPDAAVVLEGAGGLLTLQTELDGPWVVFLLQRTSVGRLTSSVLCRRLSHHVRKSFFLST